MEALGSMHTKRLLACGAAAGPLYLTAGLAQALTREGFDITRHDLSLLSNGSLGWVQIANFMVSGLLVVVAAAGMRRVGVSRWAPRLIAGYGWGLIGAGLFTADPALGFPPGTPADAHNISWHGLLHLMCGGLGFLALIAACFVFARQFARSGRRGWAVYSTLSGLVFFASFAGIASGAGTSWTVLGFWAGVIVAWAWLAAVALRQIAAFDAGWKRGDDRDRTGDRGFAVRLGWSR